MVFPGVAREGGRGQGQAPVGPALAPPSLNEALLVQCCLPSSSNAHDLRLKLVTRLLMIITINFDCGKEGRLTKGGVIYEWPFILVKTNNVPMTIINDWPIC